MKTTWSLIVLSVFLTIGVYAQENYPKNKVAPFKKTKIACVGNSITEGAGASNRSQKGYVGVLASMLGDAYEVGNFGVSGATACRNTHKPFTGLDAFNKAKEFQPDIVTIALGTNDSQPRVWNTGDFARNFEKDLSYICDEFINLPSKPTVYLCLPIPIVPNTRWQHQPGVLTNEIIPLIRKIANDKGLKIIDLNTPLIDKADYYADFLHPNDIGHRVMAEEIYKFLRPGYNFSKLKREKLDRGLVAVRESKNVVNISWRYFSSDSITASFDIYRNGKKINKVPIANTTYFKDHKAPRGRVTYEVRSSGKSKKAPVESFSKTLSDSAFTGYINIPLDIPAEGTTTLGQRYFYSANDASIGDVDGDGEYEIILKWEPSNAHDNAHDGFTGNVYFDCYKLNGRKLWRIDLGKNIRAGAHYTQFMVFDLDADNKAEVVMKTADGTKDGKGNIIGDPTADYRNKNGRILTGPEFLTVFEGQTGKAVHTTDYIPPRGNLMNWGDDEANRADRFLDCIAYLDGEHPSVVMCRGYYTRSVLAAFDYKDGKLTNRWVFDSDSPGNEAYAGQGNHNLRVGDVDGDGCDEIIYGSCAIDNTGKGLYSTGMGHGDAMHLTAFDPASKKLQVWDCHENKRDGSSFRDAETGKVIFQVNSNIDVGRCMAADIAPNSKGVEMWSIASQGIRNISGEVINSSPWSVSMNMASWWDDDLSRELLDGKRITKYNPTKGVSEELFNCQDCSKNNGTKSNPCLSADILGDWREELLLRTADNKNLRIYLTPYETPYRFHTFLEDPVYRISIATQNVAYNQPTQPGFYFGSDLGKCFSEKELTVNDDHITLDAGNIYDSYQWSIGGKGHLRYITTKDIPAGKKTKIEVTVSYRGYQFTDSVFVTLNPQKK